MNKFRIFAVILFCLLHGGLFARPVQLTSYDELMSALRRGYKVRVVAHYGECKLILDGKETKAPDAIGGMEIDVFEHFAKNSVKNPMAYVVFSHASLINLKGFIYNYAKFKIFEDNRVEIQAQYVKPVSFKIIMDETFYTSINSKNRSGAVYFYCEM